MLTVASISTNEGGEEVPAGAAPSFTVDSITTSSLLVNYGSSLVNISLGGFFEQLSEELNNIDDDGAEFRLGLLQKAPSIDVRRLSPAMDDPELAIVGLVAIEPDQSGGVTILGATSMGPLAMSRHIQEPQMLLLAGPTDPGASQLLPPAPLQRSVYLPSPSFSKTTNVERLLTENADPLLRRLLNERPLRLSSASLKIFLQAHRILSSETVTVNRAAAGLFRRVEALQEEFRQQIATCSELLTWIQQREEDEDQDEETTQTEEDEGLAEEQDSDREADGSWPRKKSERRMLRARNRQEALISRWSALQRKADRLKRLRGGGELSGKEKEWMAWISEVEKDVLGVNVWEPDRVRRVVSVNMKDLVARDGAAAQDGEAGGEGRKGPKERFEEVMRLGRRLVEDCEGISRRTAEQDDEVRPADATEDAQTEAVEKDSRRSSVSYSTSANANANANANNSSKMGPSTNRRSVMGSSRGTAMNTGLRNLGVPKIVRQEKMEVIRGLLERESALVRAAQEKLDRLTVR